MRHQSCILCVAISLVMVSFLLFGSLIPLTAQEQPVMRAASLSVADIQGTAQIFSRVEQEKQKDRSRVLGTTAPENWQPLRPAATIQEGDQLRTGPDSTLELKLNDGTVLSLTGDSLVVVERLRSRRVDEPQKTELFLERGTIKTRQPTQILGQTLQIIRTENGRINTQLGEVEVHRPFLLTQNTGGNNKTNVNVLRGSSEILASGQGQMDVRSLLKPDTCLSEDGVQFFLKQAQASVRLSRLIEQNGFRATASQPFEFLVATEGAVNKVSMMTHQSKGEIDLDGLPVVDLTPNSSVRVTLHSLLTAGIETSDVTVKLACDDDASKGINDFGIQAMSGGVTILRTGEEAGETTPSRGTAQGALAQPTATPATPPSGLVDTIRETTPTPTPTPTPEPDDDDDDVVDDDVPIPPLPPAPRPGQLTQTDADVGTHVISNIQVLSCHSQVNGQVSCGQGTCGINQACITMSFFWDYPSDLIEGGALYIFDPPTPPGPINTCTGEIQARYIVSQYAGDTVQVSHDGAGTIRASFCGPTGTLCTGSYNYAIRVTDKDFGEVSPCTQFTVP